MTPRTRRLAWRACIVAVVLLLAITYSPLVMRESVTDPWLFGMPRTLWASLLCALGIVALTAIGAAVQSDDDPIDEQHDCGPDSS